MKVKELMYWLGKLDPEVEVMQNIDIQLGDQNNV